MWFAGMLINFRPGNIWHSGMTFLAKVMPKFSVKPRCILILLHYITVQVKMITMTEQIVDRYLEHATTEMFREKRKEIRCPCRKCKQKTLLKPFDGKLQEHLLVSGFMDSHKHWMIIDEEEPVVNADEPVIHADEPPEVHADEPSLSTGNEDEGGDDDGDQTQQGNNDADTRQTPLASAVRDPKVQELLTKPTTDARGAAREKSKLRQLETDSNTPLYDGCDPKETRLKAALELLEMKAKYKWSDKSADACLKMWSDRLPKDNTCPKTLEEAKKVVCPLDLPVERYHACINDCYIYKKADKLMTKCPVCDAARYKLEGKKVPRKVVWYLPLTPRLQRYFADPKEARRMVWHKERKEAVLNDPTRSETVLLTHPSDASQWKALDREYRDFGKEPRNIRLGMSTDGVNPFGNQSTNHSTWPVFICIYNLPPGCAKRRSTFT
jgi:hypothetical protein